MKREAFDHPKLKLCAAELGIRMATMRGIIESLWLVASINWPRGDVGRWSNRQIAAAIDTEVDPDELMRALVNNGLLDEIPAEDGRLYVHDWHEHCDRHVNVRLLKRRETYANGAPARRKEPGDEVEREGTRENTGRRAGTRRDPRPEPAPEPEPEVPDQETLEFEGSTVAASGGAGTTESSQGRAGETVGGPSSGQGAPTAKRVRREGLSHFVPEDFALTRERIAYAAQHRLDSEVAAYEFGKFRDHEFQAPHSDWDRAWRRWVRVAAERVAAQRASPTPQRALTAAGTTAQNAKKLVEEARNEAC